MQIESKFRKLFWVRIGIGFLVLIAIFYMCLNFILKSSQTLKNPFFIVGLVFISFLLYVALDLFKIFKLKITGKGIEKTLLISKRTRYIPFKSIIGIKKQKLRMRTKSGNLTDGYSITVLQLENNKTLVISPDNFENYEEIICVVKDNLEFLN